MSTTTALLPARQWQRLRPHSLQSRAWRSQSRTVVLCCGRFSGKTTMARRRVVAYLPVEKPWPDPKYFFALPTYAQARLVAWEVICNLVPKEWLAKPPSESKMVIETIFGSKLFVVGLDKPARIEGAEWDGGVIDESSDQRPGVYDRSIRPALAARQGWCWRIGVPKRFGPGAREFKNAFEMGLRGEGGYEAFTWPSWDVADPQEIEALRAQLDTKDFNEQIGGKWVDAGGKCYYEFDAHNVRSVPYNPNKPIVVGSDFNVDPMAWILAQFVDTDSGRGAQVFDEIWLRNTNTQETLNHLWQRYGTTHKGGWVFVGDASSRARKTAASKTDYRQILQDERFKAKVRYDKSNPGVQDRVAAVNAMLRNAKGETRLWIDTRCVHLIDDLTNRALDPYGNPVPAEPGQRHDSGHATDALGYFVYKYFPLPVDMRGNRLVLIGGGE